MAAPPADPSDRDPKPRDRSDRDIPRRTRGDRPEPEANRDMGDLDDDSDDGGFEEGESLRGRVLVASRRLRDPNFFRTLVLLIEHGEDGAMGLVVNRPTNVTVADALDGHFEVERGGDGPVYCGGPVEPAALFVLHNSVEYADGELPVASGLFAGHSKESFEGLVNAVDAGDEEVRYRVFSGCAGWGPGQLEGELARSDWRLVDGDVLLDGPADPVFGTDPYAAWESAARSAARSPFGRAFGPRRPTGDGFRWN